MKIQLKKARSLFFQRWRFVIVARNGEVIATSELYTNRVDAIWTMKLLKNYIGEAELIGINGENL